MQVNFPEMLPGLQPGLTRQAATELLENTKGTKQPMSDEAQRVPKEFLVSCLIHDGHRSGKLLGGGVFGGYVVYDLMVVLELLNLETALRISVRDSTYFYFAISKPLVRHGPQVTLLVDRDTGRVAKGGTSQTQLNAHPLGNSWIEYMEQWVSDLESKNRSVGNTQPLGKMISRFSDNDPMGSDVVTRGIRIRVSVLHLPEMSDLYYGPITTDTHWFAYRVTITFEGDSSLKARLESRTWHVMDGEGKVISTVDNQPGVIGLHPYVYRDMEPFQYVSQSSSPGGHGFMQGSFQFQVAGTGEIIDAIVGRFTFDSRSCSA
eukprot:gb/GEZN01011628.1/.p1 GENE.gb/GEZN01011628.1/~~gb/GEZN01011628.1/.p1  ORF type:complete len:319 (+),score=12.63 gb/GEZN01011628.1/:161-1117(+)